MSIGRIVKWFKKAVPEPTEKNFNTQFGCDLEETVELLAACEGHNMETDEALKIFQNQIYDFAEKLKKGEIKLIVKNRVDFLDAVCDKIVTSTGMAVFQNMDVEAGLEEVSASNDSKFDLDGNPIFDDNRKIMKGPNYWKANLESFV